MPIAKNKGISIQTKSKTDTSITNNTSDNHLSNIGIMLIVLGSAILTFAIICSILNFTIPFIASTAIIVSSCIISETCLIISYLDLKNAISNNPSNQNLPVLEAHNAHTQKEALNQFTIIQGNKRNTFTVVNQNQIEIIQK